MLDPEDLKVDPHTIFDNAERAVIMSLSCLVCDGEKFFLGNYGPKLAGDISVIEMTEETLLVQSDSCLGPR